MSLEEIRKDLKNRIKTKKEWVPPPPPEKTIGVTGSIDYFRGFWRTVPVRWKRGKELTADEAWEIIRTLETVERRMKQLQVSADALYKIQEIIDPEEEWE